MFRIESKLTCSADKMALAVLPVMLTCSFQSLRYMQIKGFPELSPEQREECFSKLRYASLTSSALTGLADDTRGLLRERDEKSQSVAVNAAELEERLR